MNKKYLSVILFGAILMTSSGTFISCKDYDDDIDNLQEQIDNQKSDLSSKLTAVESSISSLQSAQTNLQSAINDAKDDAKKAALAAQEQAIATAKAELETVQTELQTAIKANTDDIKAVKDAATKAEETMAKVIGRVETLEAFKTTTEAALSKLGDADTALNDQITSLSSEVKGELITLGQRLTAVEAQVAVLEKYKTSNDAAVKGNKEAIDQLIADLNAIQDGQLTEAKIKEIAEQVTKEVGAKWDLISAALNRMVTHVSLYATSDDVYNSIFRNELNLVSAKAVRTYIFGQGLAGKPISFTKDAKETWEDSFIIRVSPTNATLDESMIRLVNSEMKDLSGLLNIEKIEPYTGLLTTRGISTNGLWKVSVKLVNNYDETAYETAANTYKKDGTVDKQILYAVMINDNAVEGSDETREVVSEYGITLSSANKTILSQLSFNVDKTVVGDIKNRWNGQGNSFSEDGTEVPYIEKTWKTSAQATPTNVIADDNDYRNYKAAYSVKPGQTFTVNFDADKAENIRGFYVALDTIPAVESAPSEINAWKSYKIEGLNTVTSSSSIDLTIPKEANAEGDYIGFRVYAVNYDGSLVDPDGKAFYIYVGETAQSIANLTLTMDSKIVTPLATTIASKADAFSTANWTRAKGGTYQLIIKDADGDNVTTDFISAYSKFVFTDKNNAIIGLLTDATHLINTDAITNVAKVAMVNVPPSAMKDGVTYTATITAKNPTSGIVAIATIKFSKVLPSFPATVYPFTNILVNQNLKIYPVNANAQAEYDMKNVWHGIDNNRAGYDNLKFDEKDATSNIIGYIPATNMLTAPSNYVNPKDAKFGTKFPMSITYNYGPISRTGTTPKDFAPSWGENFTIELGNYVHDCTFAWKNSAPKVTYPGAVNKPSYIALSDLKITDWYNDPLDLTKMNTADTKENTYMKSVTLHFLTNNNERTDEYYEFEGFTDKNDGTGTVTTNVTASSKYIQMKSKSNASQGADVSTMIQLTFEDNFGYSVEVKMETPFIMTFQQ